MKAIVLERFGGVEHLKMADVPDPCVRTGEVRIRIACCAFNPVDYKIRRGGYGGQLPLILGADCSGVIDQVGPHVQGFSVGDEVVAMPFGQASNGSYAELVCLPASFVAKKPQALSFAQGASFPVISLTAYRSLIAAPILQKGDTLFIAGVGGGVGSFAVELARHKGVLKIVTIARDEKSRHHLIKNLEIHPEHIVLYDGLEEDILVQRILECNQGRPFDVSCDLVGGERKALCMKLTRHSGRFTTIVPENEGFSLPSWERGSLTFAKNLIVHFGFVGAESFSGCPEAAKIYAQQLTHITELIEKKILRIPVVTIAGPFSLQTVRNAHQLLEEGHVKGKLVMIVNSETVS